MVHGGAWHYAPRVGESQRKNGRGWLPAGFCPLSLLAFVEAVETAFEEDEPDGLGPSEVESPSVIAIIDESPSVIAIIDESPSVIAIIEATIGETHVVDEVSPADKPA
jgi:hypothetical protein